MTYYTTKSNVCAINLTYFALQQNEHAGSGYYTDKKLSLVFGMQIVVINKFLPVPPAEEQTLPSPEVGDAATGGVDEVQLNSTQD